jgi:hypothetical protein
VSPGDDTRGHVCADCSVIVDTIAGAQLTTLNTTLLSCAATFASIQAAIDERRANNVTLRAAIAANTATTGTVG